MNKETIVLAKKIIIVGGGPAGYIAAIRGAQLGAEVCLVERAVLGGTCLHVGCIPTKVLLHAGEFYHKANTGAVPGVISSAALDWGAVMEHKEMVVRRLTGGVSWLLEKNGVRILNGHAVMLPGQRVQVGEETLTADAIVLAAGSVNTALPFPGNDLEGVIDSTAALSMQDLPESIAIVGGGVIGVEFATLFSYLGAKVTMIEMMPEILPTVDAEIAGILRGKLEAAGIRIGTGARLTGVKKAEGLLKVSEGPLVVSIDKDGQAETLQAEKVLVAVGRRPNTAGLGLEDIEVAMDRGAVVTDDRFRTSVPGLYAIGDCNGKMMLAHAAMEQGIVAVEDIMGVGGHGRRGYIPACVYASPEIASVGLTEEQVLQSGVPYTTGRFSLAGNGKALIEGQDGLIKIIADKAYGEILGVHMIGPKVTEMIAEATMCMNMEGTVEDVIRTVHAHPTVSESVGEAAMAVLGMAIHGS